MASYTTQDLQEEFFNVIRTGQETVVEAVKTCVDTVKSVTPKVPSISVPLAGKLLTPEGLVTSAYDFAEKLLSSQRQFAEELVKATAPLLPGTGTTDTADEPADGGPADGGAKKTAPRTSTKKEHGPAAE